MADNVANIKFIRQAGKLGKANLAYGRWRQLILRSGWKKIKLVVLSQVCVVAFEVDVTSDF